MTSHFIGMVFAICHINLALFIHVLTGVKNHEICSLTAYIQDQCQEGQLRMGIPDMSEDKDCVIFIHSWRKKKKKGSLGFYIEPYCY